MKKPFYIFTFLFFCAVLISMYSIKSHSVNDSPEATLIKAFDISGAKVVNSEIYFWAKIDKTDKNFNELKLLAEEIADELGVEKGSTYSGNTIKNDLIDKFEIKGISHNKQIVDLSVRIDKTNSECTEKTISGTITEELSDALLKDTGSNLTRIMAGHGVVPQLNTCIVGSYEGVLNDEELNRIAKDILTGVEAKKIEGIRDNKLISVSAYSPNISDSIKVNGKKVNLNLAVRYNNYEKKTYIWLATPVITKEY